MTTQTHLRLWLYIAIAITPGIIDWFQNSYDFSVRGISLIFFKSLLTGAVTARAYIDQSKTCEADTSPKP